MRYIYLFLFAMMLCACSDDGVSVTLCDCQPDEYCVDDTCYPTDGSVAPPPIEPHE